MNDNATSGKEVSGIERQPAHRNELAVAADETTLKRARWESLRLAPCPGAGRVNVCNYSYGVKAARSGEHTYTVTVERGEPTAYTCPAAKYHSGPCKHALAVADRPDVIAEASRDRAGENDSRPDVAVGTMADKLLADDGRVEDDDGEILDEYELGANELLRYHVALAEMIGWAGHHGWFGNNPFSMSGRMFQDDKR